MKHRTLFTIAALVLLSAITLQAAPTFVVFVLLDDFSPEFLKEDGTWTKLVDAAYRFTKYEDAAQSASRAKHPTQNRKSVKEIQ
jgi:hypothetical protein